LRNGNGPAWAKRDVVKDAAVFAERNFAVSAAVEIVEDDAREATLGDCAKVVNVDGAGRESF
jgi:hypothetical protein